MTKVSVIIPYYQKEKFIYKTVNSIINQTYINLEIIIIDDELTEKSKKILIEIKKLDNRIFIYDNNKNQGAGMARNLALKLSTGKYLAFCDSDDLWDKNKLEKQLNYMINYDIDFSFTSYNIIDERERIISTRKARNIITFNELLKSCDIGLSTVMIKKDILKNDSLRFANLKTKEDYVLWLYIAKNKIKMVGINEQLVSWRKSANSLSSSTFQKIFDGYKVYRNYLDFNVIKSLFYLLRLSINYILKS